MANNTANSMVNSMVNSMASNTVNSTATTPIQGPELLETVNMVIRVIQLRLRRDPLHAAAKQPLLETSRPRSQLLASLRQV